jgi:hypothetical protein
VDSRPSASSSGIAAIYEFGVKGRKRLSYRVQLDTTAKDVVATPFRGAFQRRVLGGQREPGSNSDDCRIRDSGTPAGVVRCARDSTDAVLRAVADTPGALGYTELGAAAARDDLALVRIGGHAATVAGADQGTYPFWETEFGYTWGEPPAAR